MRPALIAAVLALIAAAPSHAQDFDAVEIRAQDLGGGVHMLTGRGGNIAVSAGADGVLLVDDQFAPLTAKILSAVASISAEPVRFVINTHWHGDHTGGNQNLQGQGALIVAHRNVRERMSVEQFMEAFGRRVPASPEAALPVLTFDSTLTLHRNGRIDVIHVEPAHTDGDSIVHFQPANVIHMGDTYFNGGYPFIDASSGGRIDGVIAAANRALELSDPQTKIIPGHGSLSNAAELRSYRDMLEDIRKRVSAAMTVGKSVDEVVSNEPTASYDAQWGGGFIKPDDFVRSVYATLAR
jgi:glyoxylase-like metal-dependent hydrolase (beta-lactamase superfamily II)